jgi:CheY-like chemotaxis protein
MPHFDIYPIVFVHRVLYSFKIATAVKNILLIDDDNINNFVNRKLIERFSGDVEIKDFLRAEDALDYLKDGNHADIIFLDLTMPGMGGWGFLEKYEGSGYNIPVFILTTSIDPNDKVRAEQYRCIEGFFVKPLKITDTPLAAKQH